LEELATNQYTAAVIDMHMPGVDGIEVARLYNFSNPDEGTRVPIIMMTADNRPEVMADADFAGITRFLVKPLKPSLLVEAINSVINPRENSSQEIQSRQEPSEINFPAVLDRDVIAELLSYMEDADQSVFFAEFLEDARTYMRSVEKIISSTTLDKLRDDMHALCGAARTVGAKRLAAYARRVEFMAADELKSSQQQIAVDLTALIDESERALRNLIVAA
jgi:two-component system, sensor histidine kinase RpfC